MYTEPGYVGQPTGGSQPTSGGGDSGGIVGGLINLGTAIYSAEQQKRLQEMTAKANKDLAEFGYNKDLEMWQRMNEYNSPAAQMARFQEAGLNPHLIYGQGNAGNASSMPNYQAPRVNFDYKPADISGVIGQYQDFQMRQAQIDNMRAMNDNINARTVSEATRNVLLEVQGKRGDVALEHEKYTLPDRNAIVQNQSRSSEAKVNQEWQKVSLLSQEQILKNLAMRQAQSNIAGQDLENQRKQADLIFQSYRNDWLKYGVTTSDHILVRTLARMLSESGISGGAARSLLME